MKEIEGNPGRRKLNENEPVYPAIKINQAPKGLSDEARRVWFELGNQLCKMGLLQTVDSHVFWRYCDVFARWLRTSRYLESMVDSGENPTGIRQPVTEQVYKANEKGALIPVFNPDGSPMLRVKYFRTLPEVAEYHKLSETLRRLENELGLTPAARTKLWVPDSGGRFGGRQDDQDPFE